MKIKLFLLLFSLCSSLFAQTVGGNAFAPFVSRLKASPQGGQIILTWKNSSDIRGDKLIYRHTKEITEANLKDARLVATVQENVESYTDTPGAINVDFYYAVLIQDKSGVVYKLFIPYRNKTSASIAVSTDGSENVLAAGISDMQARVVQNKVIITFKSSKNDRELIIYRSTQPILTAADIEAATFSESLSSASTTFTDTPIAGVDFYYAIIDSALAKSRGVSFIAGQNSLAVPVQIAISSATIGFPSSVKRTFPLPSLNILYSVETGTELEVPKPYLLPHRLVLKAETASSVSSLISQMESFNPQEKELEILSIDKTNNNSGDAAALLSIISGYLVPGKYPEGELKLKDFLKVNLSAELAARAHFYLAQSYYFQNRYKDAFFEFLLSEDFYYSYAQSWLDVCFKKIEAAK